MYYYNIYGLVIKSDYELEEAVSIEATESYDISLVEDSEHDIVYEMTDDDKDIEGYRYHYEKNRAWIRYPNQGAYIIKNGSSITYKLYEGYNHLFVNEIVLCLALPIAITQRYEELLIHGSGLVWNDKCFIVSGMSGAGKSTVTNALLDNGAKYMADDTVAVSAGAEVIAHFAYPQQKLCLDQVREDMRDKCEMVLLPEDNGVEKYAVRDKIRFYDHSKKLDAFFMLVPTDSVSEPVLEELHGAEALGIIMKNLYRYDVYRQIGMPPEMMKKCMKMAMGIKVYKLLRPLKGMTTTEQIKLIESGIK